MLNVVRGELAVSAARALAVLQEASYDGLPPELLFKTAESAIEFPCR